MFLRRPYFKDATIHASEKALNRVVKWAHVLEVDDVGHLLNGDELILTTGLTWENSEGKGLDFLRQIIERRAAGLVVDMGRVIESMPERKYDSFSKTA
ncbi:PucR family transcriptional regulator ligand-binding domain-containing protein [Terrilactibacillus sp. S3-3]|nr:PucR family transcriptional regulator ligand-binding domain-containing protein [Terrilactibacillus sp. S3-3]